MRGIANIAMPSINTPAVLNTHDHPPPQIHLAVNADLHPATQGALFLVSKTGLILESASGKGRG
jgi:hypothetical protein